MSPAAEYPRPTVSSSFASALAMVLRAPSARAVATTFLSSSGRARALPIRLFAANARACFSVPAESTLQRVRTSAHPRRQAGTGTSARHNSPVRRD